MPQYVISIMRRPDGGTGQPRRHECGRSAAVTRLILDWKRCGAVVAGAGVPRVPEAVGGLAGLVRSGSLEPRPHPAVPTIRTAAVAALITSRSPGITLGWHVASASRRNPPFATVRFEACRREGDGAGTPRRFVQPKPG
ncbi:hypothetical protein Acsp03_62160 [Actinomadura sp. NBRC 104412]|nr:hypothetical protein Acsp03_62160 [Actinomadura sp. NBRC 104412]